MACSSIMTHDSWALLSKHLHAPWFTVLILRRESRAIVGETELQTIWVRRLIETLGTLRSSMRNTSNCFCRRILRREERGFRISESKCQSSLTKSTFCVSEDFAAKAKLFGSKLQANLEFLAAEISVWLVNQTEIPPKTLKMKFILWTHGLS